MHSAGIFSERFSSMIYIILFAIVLVSIFSNPCEGQVTFSRDWNAGKRGLDSSDCRTSVKTATAMCHMLVNEIRNLAGCEARAEEENGSATVFTGKR